MQPRNPSRGPVDFRSSFNLSNRTSGTTTKSGKKSIADYEIFNDYALGQGTFGTVLKARDKQDGRWYALKKIDKTRLKKGQHELVKQEIKVHKYLRHPHIARMRNYFEDSNNLYFVLDYIENGRNS